VPPDPYWNATAFTGAALPFAALVATEDQSDTALGFLRAGRAVLGRGRG